MHLRSTAGQLEHGYTANKQRFIPALTLEVVCAVNRGGSLHVCGHLWAATPPLLWLWHRSYCVQYQVWFTDAVNAMLMCIARAPMWLSTDVFHGTAASCMRVFTSTYTPYPHNEHQEALTNTF